MNPPLFRREPFDGALLQRRLTRFLSRLNTSLTGAAAALPDFEVEAIEVSLSVDAGLNVGFAGVGGHLDRERSFTFSLKPKPWPKP